MKIEKINIYQFLTFICWYTYLGTPLQYFSLENPMDGGACSP